MGRKRIIPRNPPKPQPLTLNDKRDLARILRKARAFKAYYAGQRKPGT